MLIKVRSYTDKNKKYRVHIDMAKERISCNCNFWLKYGILNSEPCKHMIDATTAFIIAQEYGIKLTN